MTPAQQAAHDAIVKAINDAVAPAKMGPFDAIEVLEEIEADIVGMLDALREENPE